MRRGLLFTLGFAVLLFFLPEILKAGFGKASVSYLSILLGALTLAVLALSWDILARTGQLSLAHAAFYGAGGYTAAILGRLSEGTLWLGIPAAALVGALLALALGSATLRLRGIYFAIATLAFSEVLKAVVQELPSAIGGGPAGVNLAPLFRPHFIPGKMQRWEIAFIQNHDYFLLYAGLLILTILISLYVQRSRLHAAFTAVRTNEAVAGVMGVRSTRTKLLAFVLSSLLVGMLGALDAHRIGSVSPDGAFAISTTVFALVTPIFGGLYTTLGPIVGAGVLAGLEEVLKRSLSQGYLIGYGLVLVLAILILPRGIVGLFRLLGRPRRKPSAEAPPAREAKPTITPLQGTENTQVSHDTHDRSSSPLTPLHSPLPPEGVLEVKDLTMRFGGLTAVSGLSFELSAGEILAIIGPNGAGKTTTLNMISGLLKPTGGNISLRGLELTRLEPAERAHAGLGRAFQVVQPFPEMTVAENVLVGALFGKPGVSESEGQKLANRALARTGLLKLRDQPAEDLTLLQEKRLEIARALATQPQVLLLDEVMAGLRPLEAKEAVALVQEVRDAGVSIIFIEHVMPVVRDLADRVIVMDYGKKIAEGSYAEVTANPQVIEAYLGTEAVA
jgi:branched-chain amino acid transport system permease protein